MSINLTKKIKIEDPSWDFRFLLDRDQATSDLFRYFTTLDPRHDDWTWSFDVKKPEKMHRLGYLWSLMEPSIRLSLLESLIKKRDRSYHFVLMFEIMSTFLASDLTPKERYVIAQVLLEYHTTVSAQLLFNWLRRADEEDKKWIESLVSSHTHFAAENVAIVYSYLLCTSDPAHREHVKDTIIENGHEDALTVVRYATNKGWLTNIDKDKVRIIQQFRDGKSSLKMLSAFKKYQKDIIKTIHPSDRIFSLIHHETFECAVQFLYHSHREEAQGICEKVLSQKGVTDDIDAIIRFGRVGVRSRYFYDNFVKYVALGCTFPFLSYVKYMNESDVSKLKQSDSYHKAIRYYYMLETKKYIETEKLDANTESTLLDFLERADRLSFLLKDDVFSTMVNTIGFGRSVEAYVKIENDVDEEYEIIF